MEGDLRRPPQRSAEQIKLILSDLRILSNEFPHFFLDMISTAQ
jgi:hypothetical protein